MRIRWKRRSRPEADVTGPFRGLMRAEEAAHRQIAAPALLALFLGDRIVSEILYSPI